MADEILANEKTAYSFGELVHCPEELDRLSKSGLTVMQPEDLPNNHDSVILIRAHGVTPEIQHRLEVSDNVIIDSTCGIVRRLQQKVKSASQQMLAVGGQMVIFGKRKHPEVEGLIGYSSCETIIVEKKDDLSQIDLHRPISVFAQTTTNVADYENFISNLFDALFDEGISSENVQVYNTICGSIKIRVPKLREFASQHDVIVFVTGEQSSNGSYLFSIAGQENKNTFKISSEVELRAQWFENAKSIGISGAASTPEWLLIKVAQAVESIMRNKTI